MQWKFPNRIHNEQTHNFSIFLWFYILHIFLTSLKLFLMSGNNIFSVVFCLFHLMFFTNCSFKSSRTLSINSFVSSLVSTKIKYKWFKNDYKGNSSVGWQIILIACWILLTDISQSLLGVQHAKYNIYFVLLWKIVNLFDYWYWDK